MPDRAELPRPLLAALDSPPLERKAWPWTIAPAYIGLFLWVVYFDQLGRRTLAIGGLGWSALGAAAGGLLGFGLLYYVPAMWGYRTGRPLTVVASSTFGASGSVALAFVAFGLAQVVWLAVATFYAVDWTFQGLNALGLLGLRPLRPMPVTIGPGWLRAIELRSPVFLVTSLVWIFAATLVGHYLVKVIAALMNIYPVFPALLLGTAVVLTMGGLRDFRPLEVDPATSLPVRLGGPRAFATMIQMVFGFFATAGLGAADWGAVSRSPRDVRVGGVVSVAFASWVIATLALLVVAGALGRFPPPPGLTAAAGVGNFSVRVALLLPAIPQTLAGATFLVFGLGSLAPSCYAGYVIGRRFSAVWPGVSRLGWTLIGTTLAWPLVATGLVIRLEEVFTLMGAVFAPMAGAMAADYARSRGAWPGPRRGFNPAGLVAWAFGLAVGLLPLIVRAGGRADASRFQPAALFGFLAAFLIYAAMARLGAESPVLPLPEPTPGPGEAPESPEASSAAE